MPRNKSVGVERPPVPSLIEEYIIQQKQPVSWKDLVQVVQRSRPDLLSKDKGATIRSILSRDKRFVRTSRGMYDISKKR